MFYFSVAVTLTFVVVVCLYPLNICRQTLFFSFTCIDEIGIMKSAVGAAAGAAVGMILFRSGGGYRAASTAAGVGVAWGSTYERATAAKKVNN